MKPSTPSDIGPRLLELLSAARDHGDPQARAALNDWLRRDSAARAIMARLLVDEQALIDRLREDGIVAILEPSSSRPRRLPAPHRKLPFLWIPIAAALMVGAFLAGLHPVRGPRPSSVPPLSPEPVAIVKEVADAVWQGLQPAPGSSLQPGRLTLESGMASIEFASGARLLLEGPAELDVVSGMELFCHFGKIRAQVPPPARGFVVDTPKLRVVDTGTAFGLVVGEDGASAVKVLQGAIELHQNGTIHDLRDETSMVTDSAGSLAPATLPDEAFPSEARFRERIVHGARLGVMRWQESAERLAADPATLLAYTFQETTDTSRSVRNHAAKARPGSHGALVGTRWTAGRWPGKRALEFRGRGDRLLFGLAGDSSSATCLAWLRIDGLPNRYNVLLMPDTGRESALQWLLQDSGEVRLALTNGIGHPATASGWEGPVKSQPLSEPDLGRWIFIAATYDSRSGKVVHYRDGCPVGSGSFPAKLPVSFGGYAFGNWPVGSKPAAGKVPAEHLRNFTGSLDELVILSRALPPEEIARLYQEGKP
ncbi:MAG: hypothetical protein EAZ65_04575 [Verrucomicrobia bacterium]|nr:MAG: hypothetical protein EAZ84_00790 [Verrucomicrobiota bacterium]TAE88018.1 MAG: hypothetical protein EAZ82_05825 [Verrucomicrobiota bacterium]TAF26241.1 MAG: hypothetical protein EAZ71_05390 [Verrucomicrobiota bacterium]TAF41796.1 MAG: hypothetical protein EAZ65_04575 [Verrucomicrobiota bacterium]